jgi:hypothetical protein
MIKPDKVMRINVAAAQHENANIYESIIRSKKGKR